MLHCCAFSAMISDKDSQAGMVIASGRRRKEGSEHDDGNSLQLRTCTAVTMSVLSIRRLSKGTRESKNQITLHKTPEWKESAERHEARLARLCLLFCLVPTPSSSVECMLYIPQITEQSILSVIPPEVRDRIVVLISVGG